MQPPSTVTIHGPYEDAMIAGCRVLEKIIDGQDAATRKELWQRWLEDTKGWHEISVAFSEAIANALKKILNPPPA